MNGKVNENLNKKIKIKWTIFEKNITIYGRMKMVNIFKARLTIIVDIENSRDFEFNAQYCTYLTEVYITVDY